MSFYLQFDQRLHDYKKHNNYEWHAATCFDISNIILRDLIVPC